MDALKESEIESKVTSESVKKSKFVAVPGQYVRVIAGEYEGRIVQVQSVSNRGKVIYCQDGDSPKLLPLMPGEIEAASSEAPARQWKQIRKDVIPVLKAVAQNKVTADIYRQALLLSKELENLG